MNAARIELNDLLQTHTKKREVRIKDLISKNYGLTQGCRSACNLRSFQRYSLGTRANMEIQPSSSYLGWDFTRLTCNPSRSSAGLFRGAPFLPGIRLSFFSAYLAAGLDG